MYVVDFKFKPVLNNDNISRRNQPNFIFSCIIADQYYDVYYSFSLPFKTDDVYELVGKHLAVIAKEVEKKISSLYSVWSNDNLDDMISKAQKIISDGDVEMSNLRQIVSFANGISTNHVLRHDLEFQMKFHIQKQLLKDDATLLQFIIS